MAIRHVALRRELGLALRHQHRHDGGGACAVEEAGVELHRPVTIHARIAMVKPKAENWPGKFGTRPLGMEASVIRSLMWSGPAPPKATRTKSRGSRPCSVSTVCSAPTMLLLAMRHDGERRLLDRQPSASAIGSIALRAPPASSSIVAAEEVRGADAAEHHIGVGYRRQCAAAPVAGRARIGAGALRADHQHATASMRAIEPPPAPMVRMSIIGIWIGRPHSISKSVVNFSLPLTTVETSVEVPPMSRVTRLGRPSSLGGALGGDHAAGRPGHRDLDRRFHGRVEIHLAAVGAHDDDLGA